MLAITKPQIKFIDWAWIDESDKKIFNKQLTNKDFKQVIIEDSFSNEYQLTRQAIDTYSKMSCNYSSYKNVLEQLQTEYYVKVADGKIIFGTLDYSYRKKELSSSMIPEIGLYDLKLVIDEYNYISFMISSFKASQKEVATGYIYHNEGQIEICLDEENKISKIAKNIMASLLSDCI